MKIQDRINMHENERRKLCDKKEVLERELNTINEKIINHYISIQNLEFKKKKQENNWKFATPNGNLTKSEGDAHIG